MGNLNLTGVPRPPADALPLGGGRLDCISATFAAPTKTDQGVVELPFDGDVYLTIREDDPTASREYRFSGGKIVFYGVTECWQTFQRWVDSDLRDRYRPAEKRVIVASGHAAGMQHHPVRFIHAGWSKDPPGGSIDIVVRCERAEVQGPSGSIPLID